MSIYSQIYDRLGLGPGHNEVLDMIEERKSVLDIGCSSGYLAQALIKQKKCIVDGVELDEESANEASKHVRKIYQGSIEDARLVKRLYDSNEKYDYIVFADVLEHCVDPMRVLVSIKYLLAENGRVVASIPNIANWRMRWDLLCGRFDYADAGLLDKTHLRFFTYRTMRGLFENAGYAIEMIRYTLGGAPGIVEAMAGKGGLKMRVKKLVMLLAKAFPNLFANQFVVGARLVEH